MIRMPSLPHETRTRNRHGGFTLIEIAVVIVILGFLLAMLIGIASSLIGQQRRESTRQRLAGVETALALFVSQYRRLPCPANGQLAGTDANAGLEQPVGGGPCAVAGVVNSQQHGVVPWRTLGISEQDATDGWGNRLTYRVATQFVNAGAMNFTNCDPAGPIANPRNGAVDPTYGYCGTAQCATPYLACVTPSVVVTGYGLEVRNLAGAIIMDPALGTGAAYVAISHGENTAGAYNNTGTLQAANAVASGTEEAARNAANVAVSYFVDDFPVYGAGTGHFDDFLLRPAILTVANRAQLGPRAH